MKSKVVISILVLVGILFGVTACAWAELYPKTFIVSYVDYENNLLYLQDFQGHEWICEDCEDWTENDIAAAIMDDNDTQEIYDDIIVVLQYQG